MFSTAPKGELIITQFLLLAMKKNTVTHSNEPIYFITADSPVIVETMQPSFLISAVKLTAGCEGGVCSLALKPLKPTQSVLLAFMLAFIKHTLCFVD